MTGTTFLTTSALALILGLGAAAAQTGGDVRSTDRKIEKTLDNKELTPIRPIRRVGEDGWPTAKTSSPATPANPQAASAPNNPPATSAQNNPATDPQKPPAGAATAGSASSGAAPKDQAAQDAPKPDNRAANSSAPAAAPAAAAKTNETAQASAPAAQPNAQQSNSNQANVKPANNNFASIRLGTDANGRVAINERQEREIAGALRRQRAPAVGADISVQVGMAVPRDVRLSAVSADVVEVLPQFRGYSFFATRGEIAIVEPASQKVVAIVPLGSSATASREPREQTTRRTIKETATRTETRRPPPINREVTVGAAVPDEDVVIRPPRTTTIYRIVPAYPRYGGYQTYDSREPTVRIYPPDHYSPAEQQ